MTAPTPEQMRALADAGSARVDFLDHRADMTLLDQMSSALRAAADQLEAVDGWLERQYRRGWQSVPDLDALGDLLSPNTHRMGDSDD